MGLVATDADGRILIPSPDGLLIRDEKDWQKIDRSVGLHGAVYSAFEGSAAVSMDRVGGPGAHRMARVPGMGELLVRSGLASDIVYEILPQSDGSLWVATKEGCFAGRADNSASRGRALRDWLVSRCTAFKWLPTEIYGPALKRVELLVFIRQPALCSGLVRTKVFWGAQRTPALRSRTEALAATEVGLFMATAPYRRFSRITELPSTRFWAIAEGTDGTIWLAVRADYSVLQPGAGEIGHAPMA